MSRTFSNDFKEIISYSFEEATRLGNNAIRPEHLLLGIIKSKNNAACRILERMHVNTGELKNEIELAIRESNSFSSKLPIDKNSEMVIKGAEMEAASLNNKHVGTEHLILSILNNEPMAAQILSHISHN